MGILRGGNDMRAGGAMIIIREWVEHSTVQPAGRTAASASSVSKEMRGSGNSLWWREWVLDRIMHTRSLTHSLTHSLLTHPLTHILLSYMHLCIQVHRQTCARVYVKSNILKMTDRPLYIYYNTRKSLSNEVTIAGDVSGLKTALPSVISVKGRFIYDAHAVLV